MAKMNIENVVASTYLGQELDLNKIEAALDGAEYNPQQFPGLVYRLKEPKTATLIFRSGKVVCTGAKCREDVAIAIGKVAKDLEKADIKITIEPNIEVQNIVASSDLGQEINLNTVAITLGLEKVEYEPEQFPGLVYRLKEPKTATLIFRSGKVVCTGAKCREDVAIAIGKVAKDLEKADIKITIEPNIEVQNIVASSDLGQEINLNTVAITLGLEKVEYEPEQFPGLVYRLDDPKVVVLLFGSGKMVCTGAKVPEDVNRAVDKIAAELRSASLMV